MPRTVATAWDPAHHLASMAKTLGFTYLLPLSGVVASALHLWRLACRTRVCGTASDSDTWRHGAA